MKTVRLFVNDNETSQNVSKIVKEKLKQANFQMVEDDYDLAIAIGGDGSFLRMIKATNFNEGIAWVKKNGNYICIDKEGKEQTLKANNKLKLLLFRLIESLTNDKETYALDLKTLQIHMVNSWEKININKPLQRKLNYKTNNK